MFNRLKNGSVVNVNINNRTIFRFIGISFAIVGALFVLYITRTAITLFIVAFFLALALNPPVNFIASKLPNGSRGTATALAYMSVLFALGLILYATIPPLIQQSQQLIDNLPEYVEEVRTGDSFVSDLVRRFQLEDKLQEIQANLSTDNLTAAGGPIFSFFQRLSSSAISVLTVLVLTFFMLVEGPGWIRKFWELHPKHHRKHRQELAGKMYTIVTGYVNGQLLVAFIAAMSALVIMTVLKFFDINIPFIIPLAAIVGVCGLIPLIGATIGAVLVVTVSLFESVTAALIMLIFFAIYQQVENNAIQPIIQAKTVELSPLLIFIAVIFGVTLAGVLGAILAIPVMASLRIVVNDYLEHRHHGDDLLEAKEG